MDNIDSIGVGIIIGLIIMGGIWIFVGDSAAGIKISQETGNEMCQNLVGNETAIAKDWWDYSPGKEPIKKGGIVCELPSFDSTHNIVIKTND